MSGRSCGLRSLQQGPCVRFCVPSHDPFYWLPYTPPFKKTLSEKDADGNSPQDSINRSLIHLKSMQENLDKIADGKGDPKKTDAILTLFQVIGQ